MLFDRRRLITYGLVVLVILVALYFVLPELAGPRGLAAQDRGRRSGLDRGRARLQRAVVRRLHRPLPRHPRRPAACRRRCASASTGARSYQITLAGLAATRLFSAGGAGGIALTYWALRRAGHGSAAGGEPDGGLPRAALHGLPAGARDLRDLPAGRPVPRSEPGGDDDRAGGARGRRARSILFLLVADPGRLRPDRGALGPGAPARAAGAAHREHPGDDRDRDARGAVAAAPPEQRPARRRSARSGSGPPTSPSCGPASTRSARTSRRRCWCRASSSG